MKNKYIILGSNGFVGRRLVDRLLNLDQEVRLIPRDMYCSYYDLKEYIEAVNPDYIINCAAYGNMAHQKEVDAIYEVNVMNPLRLLEATKDVKYKSLILIGSSSEYGSKSERMSELDMCETNTFYGASKVAQTYLARAFKKQHKKPITVIRPFSIYGPGEADFRFIPTIIRSIKTGEQFNLVKEPSHDWIHIDDFIDGLLIATKNNVDILNIGTGKEYSNIEVVEMLEEIAKMKANYNEVKQLRGFDSNYWVADNSLLKDLGWHQSHSLLEGLKDCYEKYI
jgi:nucleoside-diphosphate-sugar epimerase